ncbi:hypothetical protein [Mycetocola sp. JXN-3]|nr:hypothetical protein [Mycetocola sp. JXN-3]
MTEKIDPKYMSAQELDEHLDGLSARGLDDSAEFHAAYAEWERREEP